MSNVNFLIFRARMWKNVRKEEVDDIDYEGFIKSQWNLLRNGVRDIRIGDNAFHGWLECGGRV